MKIDEVVKVIDSLEQEVIDARDEKNRDYALDNKLPINQKGKMSKSVDKKEAPVIKQEVYFDKDTDGNAILNAELTISEFFDKLDDVRKSTELISNIENAKDKEIEND